MSNKVWLVGNGMTDNTMLVTSIAFSEDESNEAVDKLLTEDYDFNGIVYQDKNHTMYQWTHPNGEIIRQVVAQ